MCTANTFSECLQARPVGCGWGGGGVFKGGCSTPPPPFGLQKTALTVHFKCPTVGKWTTSSLAAIKNHRKSGCSYADLFLEYLLLWK